MLLSDLGIIPETWRIHFRFELQDFGFFAFEVKDTSQALRDVLVWNREIREFLLTWITSFDMN